MKKTILLVSGTPKAMNIQLFADGSDFDDPALMGKLEAFFNEGEPGQPAENPAPAPSTPTGATAPRIPPRPGP
jgi:hypothetical protein